MFLVEKHTFGYLFMKAWKFDKSFDDVSIFEKIRNFDDFSVICSPEFDSFVRDLAIFRVKCNEQHSSIPKSLKLHWQRFRNEIKLYLQTYAKPSISLSTKH